MLLLLRTLAVILTLMTGGVLETLASVSSDEASCADEESCSDCGPECAACICCPSRATTNTAAMVQLQAPAVAAALFATPEEPVMTASAADIFQPPRA